MKKILTHLPILFFLIIFQTSTFAQTDAVREAFDDAEFFYLQEDFKEALSSYLKVYKRGYQKNANINFRIGVCYLNTTAEKEKAIPYLELASKKTNKTYTEGSLEEVNAPIDVCLYLGNAYRINGQLDNAIKAYESYIQRVEDKTSNEIDFAKQQIKSCNRAKELINKPIKVKITNIGKPINTSKANYSPFISSDGKTLAYMSSQAFYEAVMIARENNGKWTTDNINPEIQSDGYHEVESLSPDGNTLFLTVHDNFESDIYISKYNGKTWSKAKKIDKTINSKEWESHVSISGDGKQLYIASNRKGSLGGVDIFVSDLDYSGEWGEPRNIGKEINTPLNEDNPFITPDGKRLYFSSQSHDNMGGYDFFYSDKQADGTWSTPVNLKYPINTTDDDLFFSITADGIYSYISRVSKDGLGDLDIYKIENFSDKHPFKYLVKGNLKELLKTDTINNFIVTPLDSSGIAMSAPLNIDAKSNFEFEAIAGTYSIRVSNGENDISSKGFNIPWDYMPDEYVLKSEMLMLSENVSKLLIKKEGITAKAEGSSNTDNKKTLVNGADIFEINDILFDYNNSGIKTQANIELNKIATMMQKLPDVTLLITGHADALGGDKQNISLSIKRAESIKTELKKRGINTKRIETKGKGESEPISINNNADGTDSPEGRIFNRRVEFVVNNDIKKQVIIKKLEVPANLKIKK